MEFSSKMQQISFEREHEKALAYNEQMDMLLSSNTVHNALIALMIERDEMEERYNDMTNQFYDEMMNHTGCEH